MMKQAQESVAEQGILLHSTLRIITPRIIKCKRVFALSLVNVVRRMDLCLARLLEFAARGGLLGANATGGDFSFEVVFALERGTGEPAEHGDLADMS
jgi:hypothetical protein